MHDEDPKRKELHHALPTHPPDPAARGDARKVVNDGGAVRTKDYNDPPPAGAGKSMGAPLDQDVGATLGQRPEEGEQGGPRADRGRADDVRDRRGQP